jgi:DNA-directed RNA polymerase subunit RPC12/RpoP
MIQMEEGEAEEFELPQPEEEPDEVPDVHMAEAPLGADLNYRCLKCGVKRTLSRRDSVKCACGYRILMKLPQNAVSQPVSAR